MISEKKKNIYIYIKEHEVNHQQRYFFINQQRIFFFFSQICTATSTCEASHHHRPQETHPTATPRRRYPPRWPRREGETHPTAKSAAKPCRARSQRSEVTHPCRSWPGRVGQLPMNSNLQRKGSSEVELDLEVVEPCRLVAENRILVAEINLTLFVWLLRN